MGRDYEEPSRTKNWNPSESISKFKESNFKRTNQKYRPEALAENPICIPAAYIIIALMRPSVQGAFLALFPSSVMYHPRSLVAFPHCRVKQEGKRGGMTSFPL